MFLKHIRNGYLVMETSLETKQLLWGGHLWSRSYYAGTVGNMSKEVVQKYIQGQRSHKATSGRKKKSAQSSGE